MAKQPVINGKTVERSYDEYTNGQYIVNRRYQRKLVWSLEEKQAFIDSIINGYPVPLFLFSKGIFRDKQSFEIIDGMQRLNAIFSYIENDFHLKSGAYFDLESTALTKQLLDSGKLRQKNPILSRDESVKISTYSLPYSIYEEDDPEIIDEVFRRINANGKHLSSQEIRQAGATGVFAQLIRRISIWIRGDVSHSDLLALSKMKEISIQQVASDGGIEVGNVFWVKQGIISRENLRQSTDEEIVADLVAGMLTKPIPPSGASILDEYYNFHIHSARGEKLEEAIVKIGSDVVFNQFILVFEEIKNVIEKSGINFPKLVINEPRARAPRYFQILFLAFYVLLIEKSMKINDYNSVISSINGIGKNVMKVSRGGGSWSSNEKNKLVSGTVGVLIPSFVSRGPEDPMYHSYTKEIENILTQSYTENTQYEFKQGLYNLNLMIAEPNLLDQIFKTLSCMANSEKNATGYVLIGIADKKKDADKISLVYNTNYIKVGNHYITGVNGEVDKFYKGNHDAYFSHLRDSIINSSFDDYYKRQVGANIKYVSYKEKAIVILRIVSDNGPVLYGGEYYTRCGASNVPVPVSMVQVAAFLKRFE